MSDFSDVSDGSDVSLMDRTAAPLAPAAALPVARVPLQQLVSAGSLRMVMSFGDSREYVDQVTAITRLPGSPAWLLGVFGSEGNAVPLVDIAAWAQRRAPDPFTLVTEGWQQAGSTQMATGNAKNGLRALRFGEGKGAWAIRVSSAPAVVDLTQATSRAMSNNLPLQVSSNNGALMPFASQVWFMSPDSVALQVRWPSVFEGLLQELSGASAL
jgi:hypothetical protein